MRVRRPRSLPMESGRAVSSLAVKWRARRPKSLPNESGRVVSWLTVRCRARRPKSLPMESGKAVSRLPYRLRLRRPMSRPIESGRTVSRLADRSRSRRPVSWPIESGRAVRPALRRSRVSEPSRAAWAMRIRTCWVFMAPGSPVRPCQSGGRRRLDGGWRQPRQARPGWGRAASSFLEGSWKAWSWSALCLDRRSGWLHCG